MSELLFSRMQSYAWGLYFANWLLAEEKDQPVSKIEHQINTRIYNNSFCGLLMNGYPYAAVTQEGGDFLSLDIDGTVYHCPLKTVANILRMDFGKAAEGSVVSAVSEARATGEKNSACSEELAEMEQKLETDTEISEPFGRDKAAEWGQRKEGVSEEPVSKQKESPPTISITLDDIIFSPPVRKEMLEISVPKAGQLKAAPSEASSVVFHAETERPSDTSAEKESVTKGPFPAKEYGRFKPKNPPGQQDTQKQAQEAGLELSGRKQKRSPFFRGKRKEDELAKSPPIYGRKAEEGERQPPAHGSEPPQAVGGRLFQHIHIVMLKKQFGSDASGPYRFIFWPIKIPEIRSGKMWADFIVHITEPNGEETVACTDGAYKELMITLDGKEFNLYSIWDSGVYESHVTLRNKTASIYAVSEEIHREEPLVPVKDHYLDQYRYERKGQPKHFVVPFSSNSGEEEYVPIIGYVDVAQKKYPLVRREGNTLRYKFAGNEKLIRGYWKDGKFKYSVEDDNQF